MKESIVYEKIFNILVNKTQEYLIENNIKAMILGISGGIDSTVCAAICHEVSKRTGIPLIGRSLPTKYNKEGETTTADLVGNAFCDDFQTVNIHNMYNRLAVDITVAENGMITNPKYPQTPIANGNIQARLRMIYLYNLASIYSGLVIDTDNLTEHYLGYWTIHGDVGDFNPIGGLWKTEIFEIAEWIMNWYGSYTHTNFYTDSPEMIQYKQGNLSKAKAIKESLKLKPTAGLGITSNDLEEIGAESYEQVDSILKESIEITNNGNEIDYDKKSLIYEIKNRTNIPEIIVKTVLDKFFKSSFKRKKMPIKIEREQIITD